MAKDKWICLTCLILLLLTGRGYGETQIENDLIRVVREYYQLDSTKFSVEIRKAPFADDNIKYDSLACINPAKISPRGPVTLQVTAYRGGQAAASGQARLYIAHFDSVLVSSDRIIRHDILDSARFSKERREITFLAERPLRAAGEIAGKWAKRSIAKDQIVTASMVEDKPEVIAGREVALRIRRGGMEITAHGIAVDSGRRGDQIRVKNIQSGKIVNGTILDNEIIEIGLL